jgi:CheY-like chemotaxis protein
MMPVQKAAPPALAAMHGGNETILLAEDEEKLRVLVQKALSRLGYRVLEAPTGVKALEVWKAHRKEISLLLTDLMMPDGMTGKGLAQRLLQDNPKLKVVYMSGYSADVVGKDFPMEKGVNFLTKPFEAHKLAQTIRDSLDKTSS